MSEKVTWLCGKPGWHHTRIRIDAVDRDSAAQLYATQREAQATVTHVGNGWYDRHYPTGYYGREPYTEGRAFRVVRSPSQERRGLDENAARAALAALHGPGWAVPELAIMAPPGRGLRHLNGRADLFVLPDGESSVGYEVKTDRDRLTRLPDQIRMYDHCFGRRVLATTPRHLSAARTQIPAEWGLVLLDPDTHAVTDRVREPAAQERDPGAKLLVTGELWGDELRALLAQIGRTRTKSLSVDRCLDLLRDHHGVGAMRDLAFDTLSRRQGTRVHAWRTGDP
ncbi:sce7726 family protein [Deinococcus xianganensis]|uniref:Sce7726 family protein n=1 Tax=Deinococcus xianganensis TaxID=1507289 RepID=A0A6I4YIH3_9DEIO|nr:sce7726 family protein [Deinococcus xianganensis]